MQVVQGGKAERYYPPIKYREAMAFKEEYDKTGRTTVYTTVSGAVEVKRNSDKTNPNIRVTAIDDNYLDLRSIKVDSGRAFSAAELQYGNNVCIIGQDVVEALFGPTESPLNQRVNFFGSPYTVVGVLEKQGGIGGGPGPDRAVFIPLENGIRYDRRGTFRYSITAAASDPLRMDYEMGQATGLMRKIRRDAIGDSDSFEISKSQSVAESLNEVAGYLRLGGFTIGFITLLAPPSV
ncbi:hypothetical protein A3SI_06879 [Nitritalea halalkaliphila LW7]|uniref:MacB-like periplasmic core domain-containing protein n=1 Tax=Nitritalea halalkaliphila LW7 TaxID=1189621 RepID=I5C637_9BACT|nr:hypothetical protein A3SI_06879 [Nitritalea halalkaliphila LW7]